MFKLKAYTAIQIYLYLRAYFNINNIKLPVIIKCVDLE